MHEFLSSLAWGVIYPTMVVHGLWHYFPWRRFFSWIKGRAVAADMWLRARKIVRRASGGLWIKFDSQGWIQCKWADKKEGYVWNKFDGGMFHRTFNAIQEIEDYDD